MALDPKKNKEVEEESLTRTERRQRRTRKNLVAAVRKLTAEKGVDALTIRDIADEADIAMGSFYNHFQSKDDVLKEAIQEIAFQSGEIIDGINAASDDPLEIVATAFITFDGIIQRDPILGWFIVRTSAHSPDWTHSLYDRFLRDVTNGIDLGKFSVPDEPVAIYAVGGSLYNFYRARLLGDIGESSVPDFVHLMLRMLGADETAAKQTAHRVWNAHNAKLEETS